MTTTKAYEVWHREEPDTAGVYHAASAGVARYAALRIARDAGWEVTFADLRVRRTPAYDRVPVHGMATEYAELVRRDTVAVERVTPIGAAPTPSTEGER